MENYFLLAVEHVVLYWSLSWYYQTGAFNRDAIQTVLFNQCVVTPLTIFCLYCMNLDILHDDTVIPFHWTNLIVFGGQYYIWLCVIFYCLHRMAHSKRIFNGCIWRHIHSQHHKYTETTAFMALYCHPLEHIGLNLLPVLIGPLIYGSDIISLQCWFFVCTASTLWSHQQTSHTHAIHHRRPNVNFGVDTWMDQIGGTYVMGTERLHEEETT